jgi:thymidylate synthase ThyX
MQVIIATNPHPEDNAMLQALYSRSADSVMNHIKRLEKVGSGKFMDQYYKGYGHASIADCGFITIYLEGISMLAAVAIEDDPLFNGQESSTRYIDFSKQPFLNPTEDYFIIDDEDSTEITTAQEALRSFYIESQEPLKADLRTRYPRHDDEDEKVYEKAISARAFDILRGWLPAGATTNVAWTTSLRRAHERLVVLLHHPLGEIAELAALTYSILYEQYPNSFKKEYGEIYTKNEDYIQNILLTIEEKEIFDYYQGFVNFYGVDFFKYDKKKVNPLPEGSPDSRIPLRGDVSLTLHNPGSHVYLESRFKKPKKALASRHSIGRLIQTDIHFNLDYGSFRDVHRHRGGYCINPPLDFEEQMNPWYLNQLPEVLKEKGLALLKGLRSIYFDILGKRLEACDETTDGLDDFDISSQTKLFLQYMVPMGIIVPVIVQWDLEQLAYVLDLRTGKTVHPTLREVMQSLSEQATALGIEHSPDLDPDDWTIRRGTQDIVEKQAV